MSVDVLTGGVAQPAAARRGRRARGEPSGFAKVGAPVTERAMRRANRADPRRMKEILFEG